jgi:hypothetical protein
LGRSENFEAIFLNGTFHGVVLGLGVPQLVARNLVRILMTFNDVNIKLFGELYSSKMAVFAIAASFFGKANDQIGRGHGHGGNYMVYHPSSYVASKRMFVEML